MSYRAGRRLLLLGLALVIAPFAFLSGLTGLKALAVIIAWATLAIAGCLLTLRGASLLGRSSSHRPYRAPGLSLCLAASIVALAGLILLAATFSVAGACEPACRNGGGNVGGPPPSALASASCGQPCGLAIGTELLTPLLLLAAALGVEILGVLLLAIGAGWALRSASRGQERSPPLGEAIAADTNR